ncbi:MAG TPA: maleylacetate reductase [Acidimicrobiia bacterium]|nr:maleylacetate reductase [Acidimicrobiia bacterium]
MTLDPTQAGGVVTYEALPGRVVFGVGALDRLAEELARLRAERALLVASKRVADDLAERLSDRHAATFSEIVQHVPVEVAERARQLAREVDADSLVAVGGGSAVGLAKAVALDMDIPIVAVPTTYAGSELTTIYGLSQGGRKRTGRDPRVLPKVVLYDPALTVPLPPQVTGASGMNGLAHGVEAFYGPGANPVSEALAEAGIRALADGLPSAVERPDDLEGRTATLRGAWLAGAALAGAGTGIHHQICHVLGGAFGLDHGGMNAVLLPHTVRFVTPTVPAAMASVAAALGAAEAATGCFDLARRLGAPASLAALGLAEADLDRAAELCAAQVTGRPRPAGVEELRALLGTAHAGLPPGEATAAP